MVCPLAVSHHRPDVPGHGGHPVRWGGAPEHAAGGHRPGVRVTVNLRRIHRLRGIIRLAGREGRDDRRRVVRV